MKTGGCFQAAEVEFTLENPMTVESATRDPIAGYGDGGSVGILSDISGRLKREFPKGQKEIDLTVTWTEEVWHSELYP